MWMLSWGLRGRRFNPAVPTGFRTLSRPTGDFPARVVVIAALTGSLDRSLVSALTIRGCAGNEALEGVHGEQPSRLPVRGPVPAFAVILQASQLPAVRAEPLQQLHHRLTGIGVILAPARARAR
jgi:hypothetical protein